MKNLLRADVETLPEYVPAQVADPRAVIKLDANENPYGPSPRVLHALAETRTWHFYFGQDALRERLARYAGVGAENIIVTNGGDEAIALILRAVLENGDAVIDAPPSFEMYRLSALANQGQVIDAPRRADFSLAIESIEQASQSSNVKAVCLGSPNNPDGGLLPRADLMRLLELPALIMLDEAYFEFAGESAVDLLAAHPNLVIVRTFSKWAGLAGLRVGYVIAAPEIANALHKLRSPYNVNLAALIAAQESLNDIDYLMQNVRATIAERERMRVELARLGWLEPLPSRTNFLLTRVRKHAPPLLKERLAQRGILIRAYQSPRLQEYVRIGIGRPEQNQKVLEVLQGL